MPVTVGETLHSVNVALSVIGVRLRPQETPHNHLGIAHAATTVPRKKVKGLYQVVWPDGCT
jgi:hypothetical protein